MSGQLDAAMLGAVAWLAGLRRVGPDLVINAHKKLAHEAIELADDPSLEEVADVMICLAGVLLARDWDFEQVSRAIAAKIIVNESRTWFQEPDGTWQHVPSSGVSA